MGFSVNVGALRALNDRLVTATADAERLADTLSAISADTGRADSDQAGRSGPSEAAKLVEELRATLHRDGGQIEETATTYVGVDDSVRATLEDLA